MEHLRITQVLHSFWTYQVSRFHQQMGQSCVRTAEQLCIAWPGQKFRYITNAVYDLPFGKGRMWMTGAPMAVQAIAGGWEPTGILTLQMGRPFTVSTSKDTSKTGGSNRPFGAGNPVLDNPGVNSWLNKSAFSNAVPVAATLRQLGTE